MREGELKGHRRAQRRDARRRLLDAAHGLLEQRGWNDISLEDITEVAQVARTAFYRHFEDRQHLLTAMLDDVGLELGHAADTWTAEWDGSVEELRRSLSGLVDIFVAHGRLLQAISDTASRDAEIRALYDALADRLVTATAARIDRDIATGHCLVRAAESLEVARALTWMNERYLLASFGRAPFSDPAAVLNALTTIWVSTLYGSSAVRDL
ncbi:TetR/AcrR family transcriptional regulator [Streptomyces sp. NPDC088387]|uniref:TetR/AcrR family transcriptional regulator n=1 Tax=Streptomyces sp. NPDC088387 TaxID=3365859 RepID=UPI0038197E11